MVVAEKLSLILKQYEKNKLSHAFLLETNNINKCLEDIKSIIKVINKNDDNNVDSLIDLGNLPSLVYIEPDGSSIKKSQIEEMMNKFSTKPIYSKYNNYVIINADKMNESSSNSLLKFLEEPEDNIIGFLLVNNKENVLPTIKSRCEIIHVDYDLEEDMDSELLEVANEYEDKIFNSDDVFINKDIILSKYNTREDIEKILLILFYKYYNMLLNNLNEKERLEKIIDIIQNKLNLIQYNVNLELLLDSLVIEMRKVS